MRGEKPRGRADSSGGVDAGQSVVKNRLEGHSPQPGPGEAQGQQLRVWAWQLFLDLRN